jgi:pimeloyl-ACP methyl ester carboxylesterase
LHVAAEYGNLTAAALLLDRGADVNARATVDEAGVGGQTAIFHAVTQFDDGGLPVTRLETFMFTCRIQALAGIFVAMVSMVAFAQAAKPAQNRQMRANGVDLSYIEAGAGVPVVFVHGAAGDLRFWEMQRNAFAKQYRFIAYTFRYHGTGAWPDDGRQYSADNHAADLGAFLSALKAGPVHLVGLSYGGMLAAIVAVKEPQLIRSLTLAEPGLFSLLAERPEGKSVLEQWNKGAEPMIAAVKAGDNVRAIRELSALVTGDSPEDFDKLPAQLREILLDNARTLPLLFGAPPPNVTCEMLRGVKAPTLVVRGERTPQIFSRINDEVGRCVAGSKLVVISNASHPMSYDNPADFNRAVLNFVAKMSAGPPPTK